MNIVYAYPHTEAPRQSQEEREAILERVRAGQVTHCPPANAMHGFGHLIAIEGIPSPRKDQPKPRWNGGKPSKSHINEVRKATRMARAKAVGEAYDLCPSISCLERLSREYGVSEGCIRDDLIAMGRKPVRRGRELEQREAAE